jgi:caffeoyl-CoA O-methyltransferase
VDIVDPAVSDYLLAHCTPPDALLRELATETARAFPGPAGMQVSHDEGELLAMLTRLVGARRAVEVGVFTGYSSICIARGLPADGHLLACDVSDQWTSVARRYWKRAGLEQRIELRLGPALDTVRSLPREPLFDLAFIDADKPGYLGYWKEVVPRVRPGGAILADNTFSHGRVIDAGNESELVQAIRDFNDHAAADDRVEVVMLPLGDGLTLARRK